MIRLVIRIKCRKQRVRKRCVCLESIENTIRFNLPRAAFSTPLLYIHKKQIGGNGWLRCCSNIRADARPAWMKWPLTLTVNWNLTPRHNLQRHNKRQRLAHDWLVKKSGIHVVNYNEKQRWLCHWSRSKQEHILICDLLFPRLCYLFRLDTAGRQSPSQLSVACISLYADAGWPACDAVHPESLKQLWVAACSLTVWQQVWLWAGVRRGRARLDSVNKASTSSSVCPWRSLTSKHQSKTGADIICHQGFPAGEL